MRVADRYRAAQGGDAAFANTSVRWHDIPDRLARYAWLVLIAAVALALVGGVVSAVISQPVDSVPTEVVECENPPCFGGGGLPGVRDLPWSISMLSYGLAILLGVPSLIASVWNFLHRRGASGGRQLLAFTGPVLVFVGIEVLPHLLNPCSIAYELGSRELPGICEIHPTWGADVEGRYHLLDHALVGALPMTTLYWLSLRRWRPDIGRLR